MIGNQPPEEPEEPDDLILGEDELWGDEDDSDEDYDDEDELF